MWWIIKYPRCLLLCVLFALVGTSSAESVIVSEQTKVRNDTMEVFFVAKALSASPESAVLDVVTLTEWALSYQSSYPEVMMLQATPQKSQYYNPHQRLVQWSASQEIKIKSENLEEMRTLTRQLLDRLEPVRVRFLLSEKMREKIERALLSKVLGRYEDQATHHAKTRNYIRISADNLSSEASLSMSKIFSEEGTLGADFQPGFSIIKVELVGI